MRRIMGLGIWLALAVALFASMPAQAQGDTSLAGTAWRLTELNGERIAPGRDPLTLVFSADGTSVSGNGGCNQFSGPYTQNGASIQFGPLISTRRACEDPDRGTQETAYFQALESTTRYSIEGRELVLYSGNEVVARFQPIQR